MLFHFEKNKKKSKIDGYCDSTSLHPFLNSYSVCVIWQWCECWASSGTVNILSCSWAWPTRLALCSVFFLPDYQQPQSRLKKGISGPSPKPNRLFSGSSGGTEVHYEGSGWWKVSLFFQINLIWPERIRIPASVVVFCLCSWPRWI